MNAINMGSHFTNYFHFYFLYLLYAYKAELHAHFVDEYF